MDFRALAEGFYGFFAHFYAEICSYKMVLKIVLVVGNTRKTS